jgi:hypothetical protein
MGRIAKILDPVDLPLLWILGYYESNFWHAESIGMHLFFSWNILLNSVNVMLSCLLTYPYIDSCMPLNF